MTASSVGVDLTVPSMETPRGVERQDVKFVNQPQGAFLHRDIAVLPPHIGAYPARMIDPNRDTFGFEVGCEIAPDIERCRL